MTGRFDDVVAAVTTDANGDQPGDERTVRVDYLRSRLMTSEQIRQLPPPKPLVDGLLYLDTLALMYGASGIGKSLVGVDIAERVTVGGHWHAHPVSKGDALYVAAEGAAGIGIRTQAWDAHHGTDGKVTWLPEAVNIYSAMWAEALAELVAELKPKLVVLDTFARSIMGADENSARDVGLAVAHLDLIRRAAASCVLVIHHSGKDKSAGAHGSSALKGALDTELEIVGDDNRLTLRNVKQKDAAMHDPMDFAIIPVEGTASVVVVEAVRVADDELPMAVFTTLQALRAIDVPGGVPSSTWQRATDDVTERSFYRHRAGLLSHGLIVNVGTTKQPRYRPADALEEVPDDDL